MSSQLPAHPDDAPRAPLREADPQAMAPWEVPHGEGEEQKTPQLQRYIAALRRHRWLILGTTVIGSAAGVAASRFVSPEYEAQTTLWVETSDKNSFDQGPIRTEELLQSTAWIELLRSYVVLDHVVSEERLYIRTDPERDHRAFRAFSLQPRFRPGSYQLQVGEDGRTYALSSDGVPVEQGKVGEPVGAAVGFDWRPDARILRPGRTLSFTILNPRDVSVQLALDIRPSMQEKGGNFLRLSLAGTDPEQISATLNALTDRYVAVAADLKRAKLDQLTQVLDEQRRYAEANLREAEIQLESFRVQTVTLPSDQGVPLAAGLEITQAPVMARYFEMKVEQEQLRGEREAIGRILSEARSSNGSLGALSMVPALQYAPALQAALDERMAKQAELRALLQRYTPQHSLVERLQAGIRELEESTIPRLADDLRAQLLDRETDLASQIGSASDELRQIPPRAIEEARLQRQVAIAENLHSSLKQRYEETRLAAAATIPDIRVLDPAVVPSRPTSDDRMMVIALGFLGSLGLAIGGIIVKDRFDPRVRYPEEVTQGMGLGILGAVPNVAQVTGGKGQDATAHAAEAFREIRLNLVHAHGAAGPVMLTLTSPGSGDGKSFIASNLALAFADQGYRTLLIDGDIRRGGLHRTLRLERVPGLTDFLAGTAGLEEVLRDTAIPNVALIPAGTRMTNGPELLSSKAMAQLLLRMRSEYDAILVDSPPLGAGVDAFALGTLTQNLAMVLRTGTTDRAMAVAKLSLLDRLPVRLLGAILNGTPTDSGVYRYYSYIPGYEAAEETEAEPMQLEGA